MAQPTLEPEIHSPESRRVSREVAAGHPLSEKIDEKLGLEERGSEIGVGKVDEVDNGLDPYTPFPLHEFPEETNILTFRSVFVGCCLGSLVNASNLYLGLKTGWTFSANMFGAIFGFALIKLISVSKVPFIGGFFGPRENNIIQTSATAAGGLGTIFVSAIPALYQMGLMSDTPSKDFWKLITFTAVSAYFGMFFAVPLRKFFIVHIARELTLVYPTATATAFTIRSMHMAGTGADNAKKMVRALIWSFVIAFLLRVVSQYAPGILWDWNIFWWFYAWGHYKNAAIHIVNWGWLIEWTPAFIGSGMLVGLNAALSFFFGSVIAWGIIGPILVTTGVAHGLPISEEYPDLMWFGELKIPDPVHHPSPRYWLLWPGVLLMLAVSFAELAVNYKVIGKAVGAGLHAIAGGLNEGVKKINGRGNSYLEKKGLLAASDDDDLDPALPHEQVPTWMWLTGAIATIIFTCIVLGLQFKISVGVSILSIILAFFFSFLAIQCTGATDTTPITTVSKASQLIIGGVTKGAGVEIKHAQKINLIAGAVSAGAASQSTDLVNDFKVGYLLRTPPRLQWYAQMIGSFVAVWIAPLIFILFTKAYPCITASVKSEGAHCAFKAPSVAAWKAVAIAMTDPTFPVPRSSGIFAILISLVGVGVVMLRHWLSNSESKKKYAIYVPNMMVLGLAFLLPQTQYGTAMSMGALTAFIWRRRSKDSFETYCFSVAAGMIAGEGIGGVVNALFQVVNIAGSETRGTMVGCPGGSC